MGRPRSKYHGLPRHVTMKGPRYYYVAPNGGKRTWIPIPGPDPLSIMIAKDMLAKKPARSRKAGKWIESRARTIHYSARHRAKKSGVEFTLTLVELAALFDRARGRCELTGIPFVFGTKTIQAEKPWIPSIDRRDPTKGYTFENCRIICLAMNIALLNWGEDVFHRIAAGFRRNCTRVVEKRSQAIDSK